MLGVFCDELDIISSTDAVISFSIYFLYNFDMTYKSRRAGYDYIF